MIAWLPAPRVRHRLYALLALVDAVALAASFGFGMLVRFRGSYDISGPELLAAIAPFYFLIAFAGDSYSLRSIRSAYYGAQRAIWSFIFAVSMALAIFFYAQIEREFSRLTLATSFVIALIALPLARIYVTWTIQDRWPGSIENVCLVRDQMDTGVVPHIRCLDVQALGIAPSLNDPAQLNRIGMMLCDADRVVIGCPVERRRDWIECLRGLGHELEVIIPELDNLGELGGTWFGNHRTIIVASGPLTLRERAAKRVFDLLVAVPLLVLSSPFLLILAVAVKLESPGPAIFRQPRIGRGNRIFTLYKFRSMTTSQGDTAGSKLTDRSDTRVTSLGALLRKTSLDELPQLINVVKGDMSLVGPRPHALGALAGEKLYWEVDQQYWVRHSVTPGITGLAQVRGHRGTTFLPEDLQKRLDADLEYIEGWSLWRDVRILLSTIVVVAHKNAF